MKDHRTPEQVIRAIMEAQANAATLEYGTDIARDTYLDDTPGQEPGEHKKKHATVLGHSVPAAVDGIPGKGGEMAKPNPERLAGLGKKESYQGNPYLQIAKQDIINEDAFDSIIEMSDVEFEDMIDVLTVEELKDLEEGVMSSIGKGIGAVAKGAYKAGKYVTQKAIVPGVKAAARRMSTAGRADAAENKLKKLQQKRKDRERLQKAKKGLQDFKAKDKPINISFKKPVADSYELNKREYWTEQDEQDLTEGKMSPAEVKKHAAAIFKMRQDNAQKKADQAASGALKAKRSKAAVAARKDAAAVYGKPKKDPADMDVKHKPEKRGRGQKDLPHIVSQLRGVVDTKDGAPSKVKFKDGKTVSVKPKHAQSWLKKHDSSKPGDKLKMYKSHDSHSSFKSYAKEAVDAEDTPKLKKLVKGLKGSSAGHKAQAKDIEKMIKDEKEFKMKSCGCGEDPCKTYGSKEQQMKDMQEAQRRWDRSSKGRAYRRLSDEEKARLMKKNELLRQMRAYKGDDEDYESKGKMRKPTVGSAKSVYRGKKTRREQMEGIILGIEAKFLQENKDKCGPGEYWCTKDMKCKPIPKGMTTDKDGMLVKESFKHYKVTHKPSGKQYKVTAMHDKSAKEKARAQHGGTASRYSGTSTDDFHAEEKMAGVEYYPRMKKHGKMSDAQKKAVTSVYDKKPVDKKMAKDPQVKRAQRYMKVEQAINELDSKTLKNYIRKAASPVNKPSAINLASKGGFKLGKSDAGDLDAGEKEDRKAFNRGRGIQRAAKKLYRRTTNEATYDQVLKHRYKSNDSDDSPTHQAYLGRDKERGMKTYKVIPGANLDSKKGKMKAIKKQLKRRPKDYGIDGKHDPAYPSNQSRVQKMAKRQKSKKTAGQYTQTPGKNLAGDNRDKAVAAHKKKVKAGRDAIKKAGGIQNYLKQKQAARMKKESYVAEISDKMKVNYIKKAKKQVTDMEKHDLDRDTTTFVPKLVKMKPISYAKLTKRREGIRTATGKLGEGRMKELVTQALEKKRLAKQGTQYPKSAQKDLNRMADKEDKNWWKAQDAAMKRKDK